MKLLFADRRLPKAEAVKLRKALDAEGLFDVASAFEALISGCNQDPRFLRSMMG